MKHSYRMLIGGRLVTAQDGAIMEVTDPANGRAIATVPRAGIPDLDTAVEAAWSAQSTWAALHPAERGRLLLALAAQIRRHRDELAELETKQYGGPIFKTSQFDIPSAADMLEYYAGVGRGLTGMTLPTGPSARAMTLREPLGVLGLITPWNFPLVTAIAKVSPALITGNTCVLKPPSCAPLTVLRLGELVLEAGLPAGVLNIVSGPGESVGEALVKHPKIAKINFTGDSETGKRIMRLAGDYVRPVAAELGGKNAFIVLPDADMDPTIEGAVWGAFYNSGQNCGAASRFFVQRAVYEEFAQKFVAAAKKLVVGDPLKPSTMIGPVAYKGHRDRIEGFVERAKKSGARLLLGGERPDTTETRNGYFVAPTIFADCDPQSELMQEEVFGPVVGITPFDTVEDALTFTNNTRYGLCASIWTRDLRAGMVMAEAIKTGMGWLNQHVASVFEMSLGGCKESGWSK